MITRPPVLIVEDETDLRDAIALLIRHCGYEVETAANGAEALEKLDTMPRPGIILLNLEMPRMDGPEFRKRQLQRTALADIPIVLISGHADIADSALALQAVGYVQKPIDFDHLYKLIDSHST